MNYQSLFIISSIFFLFLSCQKEIKKNNPDGKTDKTVIDSSIYTKKKYSIAAPPPPPPPKLKTKKEIQIETEKQKLKINRELKKLKESVSNIIVENLNSPKPTFTTDNGKEFHQRLLDHYAQINCVNNELLLTSELNIQFTKEYINSFEKTGKYDGKIFCLYEFEDTSKFIGKIIYGRNEGGHTSDQVALITIKDKNKQIYNLPLVSWSGWDGYEILIESRFINSHKISRKIIERLGWSKTTAEALAVQPRSETIQEFIILNNGELKLVKEEITNFNFEKYLK